LEPSGEHLFWAELFLHSGDHQARLHVGVSGPSPKAGLADYRALAPRVSLGVLWLGVLWLGVLWLGVLWLGVLWLGEETKTRQLTCLAGRCPVTSGTVGPGCRA
jgi:hypothetical protein